MPEKFTRISPYSTAEKRDPQSAAMAGRQGLWAVNGPERPNLWFASADRYRNNSAAICNFSCCSHGSSCHS